MGKILGCDNCDATFAGDHTPRWGWELHPAATEAGWWCKDENHLCPNCRKPNTNMKEENNPPFTLNLPPAPRSKAVQKTLNDFEFSSPKRKEKIMLALEAYYSQLFFSAGAGTEGPEAPEVLEELDYPLRGLLDVCIPAAWKEFYFKKGFATLPQEKQDSIREDAKRKKAEAEEAKRFAHLPIEGATLDGATVPLKDLQLMVKAGMLPPNPEANKTPQRPFMSTEGIIQFPGVIPAQPKPLILP